MIPITNRDYLYGLPHIQCHYENESVNSNKLNEGAWCMCCGKPATNAHHYPPKGTAPVRHRNGYTLKPALFAVCGSGTTGCHNDWHGGARFTANWEFYSEEEKELWEDGTYLDLYGPHSDEMYNHGYWVITDKKAGWRWIA